MPSNKNSLEFYKNLASKISDPTVLKNKAGDLTSYDIEFIKKYLKSSSKLLDLGSGTGLIVNHLTDNLESIAAVELFSEFSKYISKNSKIRVENKNLLTYKENRIYDIITMFGTAHYFNEEESLKIFKNIYAMLDDEGVFILKNQFGLEKTKTVTHSKELSSDYFAQYRFLDFEIERLKKIGFKNIKVFDIYPDSANRWDDTRFYALVCKK